MNKRMVWVAGASLGALVVAGAGMLTEGVPQVKAGVAGAYSNLEPGQLSTANAPNCCGPLIAADTNRQGGAAPQTVAATPFQVAATLLEGLNNAVVAAGAAATSNTLAGVITTGALTTAAAGELTLTLTNSAITADYVAKGNLPSVGVYSITNTGGTLPTRSTAQMTLVTAKVVVGSVAWTWRNDGSTALNGTMMIAWHL